MTQFSAWSAGEVAIGVLVPTAFVLAAGAAFGGAIIGPIAFSYFGFAAIPAVAAIGAAGMNALQFLTFTVVAGLISDKILKN